MKKTLIVLCSLAILLPAFSQVSLAQTQDEDVLNIIQELLDEELATREEESIYQPVEDTQAYEDELTTAIARIHEMGITKFGTIDTYMADKNIRRDEAATMFLRFAQYHDLLGTALVDDCNFPDLGSAHSDLTDEIVEACEAGLFKGANGYFLPTASITNAQAIVVMARILDGMKSEDGRHRADHYYDVLANADLMAGLDMDKKYSTYDHPITRGDIAILLYRADSEQ